MALKTVTVISDVCVRCGGSTGPEVIPGDTVQLWMDQNAVPAFPEWVEGTIISVEPQTEASTGPKHYVVQYEADDLDGSAAEIRDCDVVSVTCVGCCKLINDYLDLVDSVNLPFVDLDVFWVEVSSGVWKIGLQAKAYSTRIAGVPGAQVTIASYVFSDPSSSLIAYNAGDFGGAQNMRLYTPAGDDTFAGAFTVLVTDSEGLSNLAVGYAPWRPRYRYVEAVLLQNETTVAVVLKPGEKIISVMPDRSDGGFYQFAPTLADPAVIEASAAPIDDNLNLRVLIHTA